MSNGIPSFQYGRVNPYRPVGGAGDVQPRTEVQSAQASQARQAAASTRPASDLSSAEQQMIDRYFPPSPSMTLRLYGPNRPAQDVNPNAVGSRLDLRG